MLGTDYSMEIKTDKVPVLIELSIYVEKPVTVYKHTSENIIRKWYKVL